jgi:hypothetical protein
VASSRDLSIAGVVTKALSSGPAPKTRASEAYLSSLASVSIDSANFLALAPSIDSSSSSDALARSGVASIPP